MPRIAGNREYYEMLNRECEREDIGLEDAEIGVLYRYIMAKRFTEGKTHKQVQQDLQREFGIKEHAYYNRLRKIRKLYPAVP